MQKVFSSEQYYAVITSSMIYIFNSSTLTLAKKIPVIIQNFIQLNQNTFLIINNLNNLFLLDLKNIDLLAQIPLQLQSKAQDLMLISEEWVLVTDINSNTSALNMKDTKKMDLAEKMFNIYCTYLLEEHVFVVEMNGIYKYRLSDFALLDKNLFLDIPRQYYIESAVFDDKLKKIYLHFERSDYVFIVSYSDLSLVSYLGCCNNYAINFVVLHDFLVVFSYE